MDDVGYEPRPSWSTSGSVKTLERQLQGFTFKGPGWYELGGDAMLVYEHYEGYYIALIYNHDPVERMILRFKQLSEMPRW